MKHSLTHYHLHLGIISTLLCATQHVQPTSAMTPHNSPHSEHTLNQHRDLSTKEAVTKPRVADPQLHRYSMATYYQAGGNIQKAHIWYNLLLNDGMPPYAYRGYILFLYSLGQYNHIHTLMPKVDKLLPNDPEIQLIFAQVLEQAGKEQEAHERVVKLSRIFPLHEEICYAAAQIFIKRHEPENAISTIDALINTAPRKQNTFIFHYSKALAQLSIDTLASKNLALESVKKSLELQPRFDRGWLLYSLIEEQLGNTKEAFRGYATYLELAGKKALIEQHVQHLKEQKKSASTPLIKSEQQAILDIATHKHASNDNSRYLKDLLTRFANLGSAPRFRS